LLRHVVLLLVILTQYSSAASVISTLGALPSSQYMLDLLLIEHLSVLHLLSLPHQPHFLLL